MKKTEDKFRHIDPHILNNYLNGQGSRKEQQLITDWFSDLGANEEIRIITHEQLEQTPEDITIPGYDEDRIHDRIHHILRLEESALRQKENGKIRFVRYFQRVAAILIIPLVIFSLFTLKNNLWDKDNILKAEIYSPPGARTRFTLPDGSTGWLNSDSYLNYPTRFSGKNRTVELTGEAYFDIEKNHKEKLIVIADEQMVKVYGTSFNVMAYTDEQTMEVTLAEGIVEVFTKDENGKERSMGSLNPGERGVIWKGTSIFKKDKVDVNSYTSWKEGKLVFRNESIHEVARKMNRWYNVNIVIRDSRLADYTYHTTFVDEKLDEVLKILQHISPITIKELARVKHPGGIYGKRTIEFYYNPD